MLGQSVNQSDHEEYDVELGPLFTAGVLVLVYGLLRRRKLAVAGGLGAIWLDQRSEFGRNLKKRVRSAMKGRTVIAVVERLDLARYYDRVVVLDAGRVAETGTYQELTAQASLFRHLVTQAGLTA